jgi:hypothetical protein
VTIVQSLCAAVLAGACVVAGVAVLAGLGWALITTGAWITAATVVLYDPSLGKAQAAGRR